MHIEIYRHSIAEPGEIWPTVFPTTLYDLGYAEKLDPLARVGLRQYPETGFATAQSSMGSAWPGNRSTR